MTGIDDIHSILLYMLIIPFCTYISQPLRCRPHYSSQVQSHHLLNHFSDAVSACSGNSREFHVCSGFINYLAFFLPLLFPAALPLSPEIFCCIQIRRI